MPNSGLSPLARGNPLSDHGQYSGVGPIPARAGQPEHQSTAPASPWAYPRSRGATSSKPARHVRSVGLSPLARGNRALNRRASGTCGPIPARAGQPRSISARAACTRAYPRSRGATFGERSRMERATGLSPLARGNRADQPGRPGGGGPIPARAGQPCHNHPFNNPVRAYPRSRGATACFCSSSLLSWGLSPLARGNQPEHVAMPAVWGPIPARAGQPWSCWGWAASGRAYPRSRGATFMPKMVTA